MNRRALLQSLGAALISPRLISRLISEVEAESANLGERSPEDVARDEAFWAVVRQAYDQSAHFVNLESGYYSPAARPVLEAQIENLERINETPSFYMRRRRVEEREALRRLVADFAGSTPEELAIVRNTTEALNVVIHGLELEDGAEALMAEQEYPSMLEAFEQRHRRYGLKLQTLTLPNVPESPEAIVELYRRAITPKTKVVLVSYVVFLNGLILPVKEICRVAHEAGAEVIVDAAHAFAHVDFDIRDLGCDYFATSLHKWLGAPLGNGLLWVKRDKIPKVWPLFGDTRVAPDDIRKFEHIGTHSIPTKLAIADAIRFHQSIGGERKEARLRYLKDRWANRVKDIQGVTLNTPLDPRKSCAIANFEVAGQEPKETAERLFDRYRLFTVGVKTGVRVAPNLHNTLDDIDRLVTAVEELSRG
ncbi:MAG: aminotransferase class V-fold PLP-dependent enzyme [Planctomycetota bacterium]